MQSLRNAPPDWNISKPLNAYGKNPQIVSHESLKASSIKHCYVMEGLGDFEKFSVALVYHRSIYGSAVTGR
jgi:hypothetical protein